MFFFLISAAALSAQTWTAVGSGTVHAAADGAVELHYELGSKAFAALMTPPGDAFREMKSLRFQAKSDHDTTIGVVLNERRPGGGNYVALFWAPANVMQQIELTPRDFNATDGPTDPVDGDGKLDVDQVESIAIFDFSHFLERIAERDKVVVKTASGAHSLWVSGFEVRSSAAPAKANVLDAFDRGFLQWMSPGGMALKFVPETGPLGEASLKATYSDTAGPYAVVTRQVSSLNLAKAKRLQFDIASENEATILVSLEMKGGGRYHLSINPPAERKVFHVDLSLDDFEHENEAGPTNFDPARWKSIAILDISGGNTQNTFWLGNLRVHPD
jgi:hypothetical protein